MGYEPCNDEVTEQSLETSQLHGVGEPHYLSQETTREVIRMSGLSYVGEPHHVNQGNTNEAIHQCLGTSHLLRHGEPHYQSHESTRDQQSVSDDVPTQIKMEPDDYQGEGDDSSVSIKTEPPDYQEDQMTSTLQMESTFQYNQADSNVPSTSGIDNSTMSLSSCAADDTHQNPNRLCEPELLTHGYPHDMSRKRPLEPESVAQDKTVLKKHKNMSPLGATGVNSLSTAELNPTSTSARNNVKSNNSLPHININDLFIPKKLSQSPSAKRTRKMREKRKGDSEKYQELKDLDAVRQRDYRKNMTEEQKEHSRVKSRERTRRSRLRKKLKSLGILNDDLIQTKKSGVPYLHNEVPTVRELQFLISNNISTPIPISSNSDGASSSYTSLSLTHNKPTATQSTSSNSSGSAVDKTNSRTTGIVDISDSSKSSSVPTDIYMWAGPDMVDSETNTDNPAKPIEMGCQLNQCEVTCQTELTMQDMDIYDAQRRQSGSQDRRKFIMADVMRDDQSCQFYTGFSLLRIVWLFDLLKGCTPNQSGIQKDYKPATHLNSLEQFFLVMIWLRQGLTFDFLAHMFATTFDTAQDVCNMWMTTMQKQLYLLVSDTSSIGLRTLQTSRRTTSDFDFTSMKASNPSRTTNGTQENGPESEKFTYNLVFQRNRNVNFMLSDMSQGYYAILSFTVLYDGDSVQCRHQPLQDAKYIGTKYRRALQKNANKRPAGSLRTSKRERNWAFVAHKQCVDHMKGLEKFNVLNTIHPQTHRLLMEKVILVCLALNKVKTP